MTDLSVIIPVKNRAGLLRKTLDNLLSQSKVPDEIIVVDDHSTDDIKLVIFDYITDCIFLNNKGTGPGAARNLGMSVATGRYIQFFDSDDLMTHRKLEKQFQAMEATGADMAYGPYVQARETDTGWEQVDVIMQAAPLGPERRLAEWMLRGWNAITQSCLFRREFLDSVPVWEENLITHEDYLYLFRLSCQNPKLIHVPEEGVLYRQHGLQSTDAATVNLSRAREKMEVLVRIRAEIDKANPDLLSRLLFNGRLALQYAYLKANGADVRPFSGYMKAGDFLAQGLYRMYNRLNRRKTGTLWEPMHGVSAVPEEFQYLLKRMENV